MIFRLFFFPLITRVQATTVNMKKKMSIVTLFMPEVVNFRLRATVNKFS